MPYRNRRNNGYSRIPVQVNSPQFRSERLSSALFSKKSGRTPKPQRSWKLSSQLRSWSLGASRKPELSSTLSKRWVLSLRMPKNQKTIPTKMRKKFRGFQLKTSTVSATFYRRGSQCLTLAFLSTIRAKCYLRWVLTVMVIPCSKHITSHRDFIQVPLYLQTNFY